MAAIISTVPQYSQMVDGQGVEVQQEKGSPVLESELTPLNPLAQHITGHLHQKAGAESMQQGSRWIDLLGTSALFCLRPLSTVLRSTVQARCKAVFGLSQSWQP